MKLRNTKRDYRKELGKERIAHVRTTEQFIALVFEICPRERLNEVNLRVRAITSGPPPEPPVN